MKPSSPVSVESVKQYIGGQRVAASGGETFLTVNPADNQPITTVPSGDERDIDRAVAAAKEAFAKGPWRRMKIDERIRILERIAKGILENAEELARLETLDTGLPIKQTRGQIRRAGQNFRFFADLARHRLTGNAYPVDGTFLNYTVRRPVGVAGLITPWNTPFMLSTWKLAPCLAAGNTCVLKPAEWSPLTIDRFTRIAEEAGWPPGVFNVVHGYGDTAGAALVRHPDVQLISFTGETRTGMEIMRNGADTLKRFSMELGGKSPVIVFEDADLDRALDAAVFGVYSLNGERCTAGSRLFLQESIYEPFVGKLKERVRRIRVGDPFDERTELGPLIHREHLQRVRGYLEIARDEGAEIAVGGGIPAGLEGGNYLEATLILGARNEMRVAQEEIFGPVLTVIPFREEEEVIQMANDVIYGLAAYVWTENLERAHNVAQAIESGMVWINSQNVRDLRAPFGGSKYSGIGREGGTHSFEFFTEVQTVHVALGKHAIPHFGAE